MTRLCGAVAVLLAVAGARAGEKEIIERLEKAGADVNWGDGRGDKDALCVLFFGRTPTDTTLADLCELRRLRVLGLSRSDVTDAVMRTVGGLTGLTDLTLESTAVTDAG